MILLKICSPVHHGRGLYYNWYTYIELDPHSTSISFINKCLKFYTFEKKRIPIYHLKRIQSSILFFPPHGFPSSLSFRYPDFAPTRRRRIRKVGKDLLARRMAGSRGRLNWMDEGRQFHRLDIFYLSIHISIYPSINLSIYLSLHLSINVSIHPSFFLYLSIYLYIPPFINLSIFISIYLSMYLSIY